MIYLTHDIDWINPKHPYSLLKSLLPKTTWLSWSQTKNPHLFLNQIEKQIALNKQLQVKPIYLIGASHQQYGRFDLRYTVHTPQYPALLAMLKEEKIGLHSDTHSPLINQQMELNSRLHQPILFHRSHFLQHQPIQLHNQLQQSTLKIDFSRGHARQLNFAKNETVSGIHFIPTLLFDNVFFFQSPTSVFEQLNYTLEQIASNQSKASILFHPENQLISPKLTDYYESTIELIRKHGIPFY